MPPRIRQTSLAVPLTRPSLHTHCSSCLHRAFSSTPPQPTKLRRDMFAWLNGVGENFRYPLPDSTNYLSAYDRRGRLLRQTQNETPKPSGADTADSRALEDAAVETKKVAKENREDLRPFPLNQHFVSQPVLSEELRQEVCKRVRVDGKSVRQVSVELGIEMRRVGAVVRLVEVERQMRAEGQPLALPYAHAVLSMLPTTPYNPRTPNRIVPHESINDLPVHTLTQPQLFYPTSESRAFNRVDAGRVFSGAPRHSSAQDVSEGGTPARPMWQDTRPEYTSTRDKHGYENQIPVLKPADSRIPHPHLIALATDRNELEVAQDQSVLHQRYQARLDADVAAREARRAKKRAQEEAQTTRIETDRWQFVVTEVQTTRMGTGEDGRGTASPGYRYGVPSQDRKRGQKKIPQRVDV